MQSISPNQLRHRLCFNVSVDGAIAVDHVVLCGWDFNSVRHEAGVFRQGHQEFLGFGVAGEVCQLVVKLGLAQGEFGLLCGFDMVEMTLMLKKTSFCEAFARPASLFYGGMYLLAVVDKKGLWSVQEVNTGFWGIRCLFGVLTKKKYFFWWGKFWGPVMFII